MAVQQAVRYTAPVSIFQSVQESPQQNLRIFGGKAQGLSFLQIFHQEIVFVYEFVDLDNMGVRQVTKLERQLPIGNT